MNIQIARAFAIAMIAALAVTTGFGFIHWMSGAASWQSPVAISLIIAAMCFRPGTTRNVAFCAGLLLFSLWAFGDLGFGSPFSSV